MVKGAKQEEGVRNTIPYFIYNSIALAFVELHAMFYVSLKKAHVPATTFQVISIKEL